jgi:hypothetical protein
MPIQPVLPNSGYIPPQGSSATQKQIEDMKAFMSKDVTELAAGLKESAFQYDAVAVRGRFMAIPRAPANRMMNSAVIACLFALKDPRIDKILHAVRAQANFVTPDGEISTQPIVACLGTTGDLPKEFSLVEQPPEPPRHIFIEEGQAKLVERADQMVAALGHDGSVVSVGLVTVWNTKVDPPCHMVRMVGGDEREEAESSLKAINSMADLVHLCSGPKQQ